MLAANTLLQDRYRIVRQLGQGGMGTVYEAVDQRLSSVVAIKETRVTTDEGREAFQREATLLANLRHACLPRVIDHFAENNGQYLVMEFISGDDLAHLLELRGQAFAVDDVLQWSDELLKALEYLHGHNPPILHRDIKPSNLKLTREGELFLIDFGLSKGVVGQMPTLQTSRSVKGYTPAYSPLEQIHGGGTDPRSDLYAVGATLYHLLTNVVPVDAPTRFNALDDLQADPLLPAAQVNPHIPKPLSQILSQAMAMNRRHRPSNATAMRQMLRQVMPSESVGTLRKPVPPPPAPTKPAVETTPLPPTRHTDSELRPPAGMRPLPEPTLKEVPNLIERPADVPATLVLPAADANAFVPSARRRVSKPVALLLISIPMLFVLVFGATVLVPWLLKRSATQNPQTLNSTPTQQQQDPTKPAAVSNKKTFSGDFNVGKALELIYGSYDQQKKYAKWNLSKDDLKKLPAEDQSSGIQPGTVYTASTFAQSFTQGGVQKFILITETVPAHYDCHGCAPIIGGALFSQQGNGWQLDSENKFVSIMGSWGSAPKGKLLKIGSDQYGVIFHASGTGQGITEDAVVIIGQAQDTVRELLMILDYGGDNAGACGDESLPACWKFSSKMDFEPGANPDYFDIKVTTTGTNEDDNGNIRRANSVKKYKFTNGKYVPAK